jgi:F0F1-type ATP synthase membrane subunit c/vacuolar-type H+-ATPase subunit K
MADINNLIESGKAYGQSYQILDAAKSVGAGSASIALAGVGVGIGVVFNGMLTSYSRNPKLRDDLFRLTILGFALTEAIGLFALLMAFLIFFS